MTSADEVFNIHLHSNYVFLDTYYYAQITHSMLYMNLHVTRLAAGDLALTTSSTFYIQKITGHQLFELNKLAQNREDWRQLVVECADPQPPD